ncbi:aldehyde oxidase [Mycobacterium sp. MS1601]|uniref:xanthine dehydrogenase family protein molybdopterin-binding subunit n=1 Tax=Mycobacterium sp. MS1601 TaxID=1936029 RepID=UPI00097908E6|nr:xanthine dehydrogenase family protein molybdopterin-binding subunit [Mycobacterium sp. MS1601]AQA03320.1 aldehyde oxidase [Mycobacterium sp. MS1601]
MQVGKPVDRVEGRDKVSGRARYTADTALDGLTYAVLVQSRVHRGSVSAESLHSSASRAAAAPGVLYVLTPLNCPALQPPPVDMTWDLPIERRPPLSDLTVQYAGQHMALVVADSWENATDAASLFDLRYTDDDGDGQGVHHGSYRPDHFVKLDDERLQDSRGHRPADMAHRVEASFATPVNAHYPIELSAVIAHWHADSLTVHDTTRWITGERRVLAAYLAIPEDRIRIISPLVGGAFGSKSFLWMHVALAAVAARDIGRPVKLVLTRNQMFTSTGHRPRTRQELVLGADTDGRLLSTEHHTETETSTVAHFCEPAGLSSRILYHSPHLEVSHRTTRTNAPTPCFMRGPGEAPGLFALEVMMDELADACGLDPLELRVRNHSDIDQASGKPWSAAHLLDCYRIGAQRFGWHARPREPRSLQRNGIQIGWGMATATYPGRRMPASCRVRTLLDGRVQFASATHEVGTGVRTVMAQIAADACGLPLDQVEFVSGDSSFPDAPYSGASQTTATVGSAVLQAAQEWRRRLDAGEPTDFTVTSTPDGSVAPSQSFGAHFCEVRVDEELGRVTVTRWVAVMDCGRVLNPKLARNQVMGGITFGLGMALLEQVPYDRYSQQLIGEYYVPTHADRPEFDITFVDGVDDALDPVGVRGIGEIGTCGVPAAITNAIFHATGRRLRSLPITCEDLMRPFEEGAR